MRSLNPQSEEINCTWRSPPVNTNGAAVFVKTNDDPAWAEPSPKYDPEAAAKNRNVVRLKQNCTKNERHIQLSHSSRQMGRGSKNESGTIAV